jgi:Photosynthetic reaction centre cytochrome C subunit
MREVLRTLEGRENTPAESVFKNLRVLRGMPAGRIPRMMNIGFGRSLGVSCDHCHVVGEWDRDDKPKKAVARQMWEMMGKINGDLLAGIEGLESRRPAVNCTTCHRGALKPALDLPPR